MAGRGGSAGELGESLTGLRGTVGYCSIIQISGKGDDGGGRKLAGSIRQPEEVQEELDADDEDPGTGGVIPKGLRVVIYGGHSCDVSFQVRDVVPDPPDGSGPGQLPAQSFVTAHREAAKEEGR